MKQLLTKAARVALLGGIILLMPTLSQAQADEQIKRASGIKLQPGQRVSVQLAGAQLTDKSLAALKKDGVPEKVVDVLKPWVNKNIKSLEETDRFKADVKKALAKLDLEKEEQQAYYNQIVTSATKKSGTLTGTLVYLDTDRDWLILRKAPGVRPTKLSWDAVADIKAMRPAVEGASDEPEPEIHRVEYQYLNSRKVQYLGKNLSPSEQEQLAELENTENEIARIESLLGMKDKIYDRALAMQAEQLKSQRLANELLFQQVMGFAPVLPLSPVSPFYFATGYYGHGYGWGYGGWGGSYIYGFPQQDYRSVYLPNYPNNDLLHAILKDAMPEALTQARMRYINARKRMVYVGDRIIAVGVEK